MFVVSPTYRAASTPLPGTPGGVGGSSAATMTQYLPPTVGGDLSDVASDSTASARSVSDEIEAADRANAFAAAEAQKTREWQAFYDRNKYSWAMEGLRDAGLNPILAYQLMSGGSASSAMAQPTKANIASSYSAEYNRIVGESANTVRSTASMLSLIAVLGAVLLRAALV